MLKQAGKPVSSNRFFAYIFAIVVLFMGIALAHSQTDEPLRLEKSISLLGVTGRIDHMAFDLKGKRLFVAALGYDAVEIIDVASGKVTGTISGLAEPQGLFYQQEK